MPARSTPEAADGHPHANVITRAVGARPDTPFALDKVSDRLRPGRPVAAVQRRADEISARNRDRRAAAAG